MPSRRRFGYVVWGIGALVVAVPEITTAVSRGALRFTTISETVGHIEYLWSPAVLIVVTTIVFALYSLLRPTPARTPAGRLSRPSVAQPTHPALFDSLPVPSEFIVASLGAVVLVIGATVLTIELWDDPRHFRPSYVLYGLVALFWLVIPSLVAFIAGRDAPFPTLFRSVRNVEDGLRPRRPWLAWLLSFAIVAGLVIELLHIALYPFPDITHILNPNG